MTHILEDLKAFLDHAPTSWHAAVQIGNRLAGVDFTPLNEEEKWVLEAGKKYFVSRGGSICAFCLPEVAPEKAIILASHTDSPSLKIKPHPEVQKENMTLLGVEVYGSPLLSSWLNRDLGIAGRIVVKNTQGELEKKLIYIEDSPLFIPQLAIHLDREVNDKGLVLNKQDHLCPIAALESDSANYNNYLETLLRRYHSFHALLGYDLFLVPLEECRFLGFNSEMIASYRLDNLASVHACAAAMAQAQKPQKNMLQMAIFWDNEEIGSISVPFISDVMKRISSFYKMNEENFIRMKNRSLCVSVDMAHAFNPNYANKLDPNNQPLLGKGVVLKHNASHKYASDAMTSARIVDLCNNLSLPLQSFVSRSDMPCGSTVGPLFASMTGIPTVDIGAPQLSMHSAREAMACQDHMYMFQLLTSLLEGG